MWRCLQPAFANIKRHCLQPGCRRLYANAIDTSNAIKIEAGKPRRKMTASRLRTKYLKQKKITMVTAYDYCSAQICDESMIDMILVGDSVGMVVMGQEDTVGVTIDQMVHHCRAVKQGSSHCFLVGDLPFGSYLTVDQALFNAARLIKEGGMDAVKIEGGTRVIPQVKAIIDAGIAVVGHVGLTPQSHRSLGGYSVQGKNPLHAQRILQDSLDLEKAGVSAVVLEMVPSVLSEEITSSIHIPTIGIGAGPATSGQVLVYHDILGIYDKLNPVFSKRYANLQADMVKALKSYRADVIDGHFPAAEHSFGLPSKQSQPSFKSDGENETLQAQKRADKIVVIIGGGAIGSLFASHLSTHSANKVFIVSQWAEHVDSINTQGLNVQTRSQTTNMRGIIGMASESPEAKAISGKADVVYILTKSRNTYSAAQTAKSLVNPNGGTVVCIQNGIGSEELVKRAFESKHSLLRVKLLFGITSYGANIPTPGTVNIAGEGCTTLICTNDNPENIANARACLEDLKCVGMNTELQTDESIASNLIWKKLAINSVINPLGTLFGVANGELISQPPIARLVRQLSHEVADIIGDKANTSREELLSEVQNVIRLTSPNRNSMLADVERDEPTEFSSINGRVLEVAQAKNLEAPLNASLASLFHSMSPEEANQTADEGNSKKRRQEVHLFTTKASLRSFRRQVPRNLRVGFVPTMGALHAGHMSLVEAARGMCDVVIVSIFVNPTQFAPHEDFEKYPNRFEEDMRLLRSSHLVDAVFAPSADEIYPQRSRQPGGQSGQSVQVVPEHMERRSAEGLARPKFFSGVSTVCTKLFNIVQPDVAFFGQKDAAQALAVESVVRELDMPLSVEVVPTAREMDGLAMSSRNVYLSEKHRAIAPILYQALLKAEKMFSLGQRSVGALRNVVTEEIQSSTEARVEYVSIANAKNCEELSDHDFCQQSTLLSVAMTIGNTRLIDNITLNELNESLAK